MKKHVQFKKLLLGGAAVGLFLAPAFAQDTTEVVTVTGIRASLQSAQSIKQNSEQVVDSITAVDIGALPDRNVAEALQRVPGVTLQRNAAPNDLTRMGSTGNNVFVRGLSWVKTLVNGRNEFSAVDGATLNFADISASLMASVDVYKSPTAKMIEGGVGGTVDLKTRKPFDQDGLKIAIGGDLTYGTKVDAARPSGNFLISDRWETGAGEFGVLFSVDWQDEYNRTTGINLGHFDCFNKSTGVFSAATDSTYAACMALPVNTITGSGTGRVMGPQSWAWRQMEFHQQRLALNGVIQWRPNQEWEITLSALNSYARSTDMEHYTNNNLKDGSGNLTEPMMTTSSFDSKGNWYKSTTSLFDSADTRGGSGHNRNTDISLNLKYNPTSSWEITTDIQFVEASHPYRNNTMYTGLNTAPSFSMDVSGDAPVLTYTPNAIYQNKSNYTWMAAMDHMDYNVAHSWTGKFDVSHTFEGNGIFGFLKGFDAGVRSEQKLAVTRSTGYNWGALCPSWLSSDCPSLDGTVAHTYTAVDGSTVSSNNAGVKAINGYAELFSYQKVAGNVLPSLWLPSAALAGMNTVESNKLVQAIQPGWTDGSQIWQRWISYATQAGCTGLDISCVNAFSNVTGGASGGNKIDIQKQGTYAVYAQFNYGLDNLGGLDIPIDGNFGVRFVHTINEVNSGKLVMPQNLNRSTCVLGDQYLDSSNNVIGTITDCSDWNTAHAFGGSSLGSTVIRPAVKKGYSNLLPSFNLRAKLSDEIQARLAYSQTMVRPDFSYTRNNANLSWNWAGDSGKPGDVLFGADPYGSGGNPYLKAMLAKNYDASVEWYFASSGSLTLSMFYKDLSNYVYTATEKRTITNPNTGNSLDFNYTTYINGSHGNVKGFELGYQQFYDFLPGPLSGLGFQANYTKLWNSGGHNGAADVTSPQAIANANDTTLPLEGMSNDSYNVALMYAKYDIDFRLAWNWRSRYLSATSGSNEKQPVWTENYGQLDGSVFYTLFDNYKVGVQATNLTGSVFHTQVGYAKYHPRVNWIGNDRKYAFVFRANW